MGLDLGRRWSIKQPYDGQIDNYGWPNGQLWESQLNNHGLAKWTTMGWSNGQPWDGQMDNHGMAK